MKQVLIGLVVLVPIVFGGLLVVFLLASRDMAPPDTSDLRVIRRDLPLDANGFPLFLVAGEALQWPEDASILQAYLDGESIDEAVVRPWFVENEEALRWLEQGLARGACVVPEVQTNDAACPWLESWRKLARVLAVKARHQRLSGNDDDATDACLSLLAFADIVVSFSETLVQWYMGMGILKLGCVQAEDLARDASVKSENLRRLSRGLSEVDGVTSGLVHAIKVEYRVAANTIDQLRVGALRWEDAKSGGGRASDISWPQKLAGHYAFQPNKTKHLCAEASRRMIADATGVYAGVRGLSLEEAEALESPENRFLNGPNSLGNLLYGVLFPDLSGTVEMKCRVASKLIATRLLVACQLYRDEVGRLPKDLGALVPKYVDEVPADPYDGKPFRYVRERGVLYSVGQDLEDDEGRSDQDDVVLGITDR